MENEFLKVTADNFGAQLTSVVLKETGADYLHDANPLHWGYHAPVLFPIVGRLKNDSFLLDGKRYALAKHGFARESMFETVKRSESAMVFSLSKPAAGYPFKFDFQIRYELCVNEITVTYEVTNKADDMYFSAGAHPAFKCPLYEAERFTDYYLEFEQPEIAETKLVTADGFLSRHTRPFFNNTRIIPLDYGLFRDDALVFGGLRSGSVALKSRNHEHSLTFVFEGFPYLGIWTKDNAPFICLEPWYGHGDFCDFEGEIHEKAGIIHLQSGGFFTCEHKIIIR